MEKDRVCSFFGHRNITATEKLYETITREIIKVISLGCRTFYFGGYGDFDDICYKIVTKIKKQEPNLKINCVFCVPQEKLLRKYSHILVPEKYDKVIYPMLSFEGWYKSIYFRNCAMIDESDFIIFYAESKNDSGAYKAYKYAKSKKSKYIINIWDNDTPI